MIKYFRDSVSKLSLVLVLIVSTSCTDIDDNLGGDLIPPVDRLKISTETISDGFNIKSIQTDSMLADNAESYYLGSSVFPRMGKIDASFVTQVAKGTLPEEGEFEDGVVADSAYVILSTNGFSGIKDYKLTVNVYELNKPLPYPKETSYYTNFPIKEYINENPDYTKTFKNAGATYIKVDPKYVQKYLDATKAQNDDRDIFIKDFPGYYFEANTAYGLGVLYNINTTRSGIKIYYHKPAEPEKKLSYNITFSHIYTDEASRQKVLLNEGFSFYKRDYSFIDPTYNFDPNSTSKSYVMGLDGYITELTIPEEEIKRIKDKANNTESGYISILKAELTIPIGDDSANAMNDYINPLVLYFDYQEYKYMPSYNVYNQGEIGGILNRVKKEYVMNITTYIQQLLSGKIDNYKLQVAPNATSSFTYKSSELVNTKERPIKLVVTYGISE
ncbi:MAG: DUF4270 family protein [Bacteroidetes bacterium]|nr:DUF4270 family protein [Bacteroidota bacterium]